MNTTGPIRDITLGRMVGKKVVNISGSESAVAFILNDDAGKEYQAVIRVEDGEITWHVTEEVKE